MQQRWTDKEVVERVKEGIKTHWQAIDRELKLEPGWRGTTWEYFSSNLKWKNWNRDIHEYHYHIVQLQNILDIKDEEIDEILKEA